MLPTLLGQEALRLTLRPLGPLATRPTPKHLVLLATSPTRPKDPDTLLRVLGTLLRVPGTLLTPTEAVWWAIVEMDVSEIFFSKFCF